jgi:putative endonuclease
MGDDAARKRLGASGERLAAGWLEARGYRILARNWRCAYGEIDLIAERERDGALAFVEVKTRRGERLGAPEEAITPAKRRRLIASVQMYLAEQGAEGRMYGIDVIAVALEPSGRLRAIRHYPNSVEGEE